MLNVISIIIGLVAFIPWIIGIIPLLGWIQWLVIAFCIIGIIFGALSKHKSGLYINIAILVVAILRTMLGGGFV